MGTGTNKKRCNIFAFIAVLACLIDKTSSGKILDILTIPVSCYSFGHLYLRLHNPDQGHLNKAMTLNRAIAVLFITLFKRERETEEKKKQQQQQQSLVVYTDEVICSLPASINCLMLKLLRL